MGLFPSLADVLIIASPTPPSERMTEAVSSPSDLGTRWGVGTGTSVDPCMVRPIKEVPDEVPTCLCSAGSYVLCFTQTVGVTHIAVSIILCTN